MDRIDHDYVRRLIDNGISDRDISSDLKLNYPEITRGLSEKSVKLWRLNNRILKRTSITESDVDRNVRWAVGDIGLRAGRRFVKGYLESFPDKPKIGQNRIGASLKRCFPQSHASRLQQAQVNLNPVPYHADYFGHKLHMDQNEKLAAFGVTHVAAIDGFSGYVVAHSTMPTKNNMVIYDDIFCHSIRLFGLWDQIVVDAGAEFNLTLSYQNYLKEHRTNTSRAPFIQIRSMQNNRIERVWQEVNSRVNYPLKRSLNHMVDQGSLDINDSTHLFSTSKAAGAVSEVGLSRLFSARNHRPLRTRRSQRTVYGRTPKDLMLSNNRVAQLDPSLLVDAVTAAQAYRSGGGSISEPHSFGTDPLLGHPELVNRRQELLLRYQFSPEQIYSLAASEQTAAFEAYVSYLIDVNRRLTDGLP